MVGNSERPLILSPVKCDAVPSIGKQLHGRGDHAKLLLLRFVLRSLQDAIQDPADVPQIKKFMNYYLPTTIKLLNAYDRMGLQGIEGENVDKSMKNINEMLDTAIVAYKKRLDSLLANQALDIETDIAVLNTMLERDGLTGSRDFTADNEQRAQGQARGATM